MLGNHIFVLDNEEKARKAGITEYYTFATFRELADADLAELRVKCAYIHPSDFGNDENACEEVISKLERVGLSIFYITTDDEARVGILPCRPGRQVEILPAHLLKGHWGDIDDPSHHLHPTVLCQALLVLCQGFLAAHHPDGSAAPETVVKALEQMGWIKLLQTEQGKGIANIVGKHREKTRSGDWWRTIFEKNMDAESILMEIRNELRADQIPTEIQNLIYEIFDPTASISEVNVSKAYLLLSAKMKREL